MSFLNKLAVALVSSVVAMSAVHAHEAYSEDGNAHWLSHLSETRKGAVSSNPFGYAVRAVPDREVNIISNRKYLNVSRLETVRLNLPGKSVIWRFDTAGLSSFPLSKIIPEVDGITVYLSESPTYQGGN